MRIPMSARGTPERGGGSARRACGLALLELLVTIMILGIVLGLVSLSVAPGEARRMDEEVQRLGALFRLAHDESRLGGRPLTWRADLAGYRFVLPDGTLRQGADDPLRPRAWPFALARLDAPAIRFGAEPLLARTEIRLATPARSVALVLDAFGQLTPLAQ